MKIGIVLFTALVSFSTFAAEPVDTIWYGSVDVVSASPDSNSVETCLVSLKEESFPPSHVAFFLAFHCPTRGEFDAWSTYPYQVRNGIELWIPTYSDPAGKLIPEHQVGYRNADSLHLVDYEQALSPYRTELSIRFRDAARDQIEFSFRIRAGIQYPRSRSASGVLQSQDSLQPRS